jgi:nicotinamidase-related amidase
MLKWEGRDIPQTLAEIVDPSHTVVIMHDIQNDNTGPDGVFAKAGRRIDVTGIVGPIASFLGTARERNVRVMYTQYTNLPGFATFPDTRVRNEHAVLSDPGRRWALESSLHGTWGCRTVPELEPRPGEVIIDKYRVDAFIGTPLEYLLRLHRIRTIVHTGIATEVGILPTAWHAINLGFFVVVPEDLVGPMQQEHHGEAMAFLRRLTLVTRAEEIVEVWKGGRA